MIFLVKATIIIIVTILNFDLLQCKIYIFSKKGFERDAVYLVMFMLTLDSGIPTKRT